MALHWQNLLVDATDPAGLARWWAQALGWEIVEESEDEVLVAPPGAGDVDPRTAQLDSIPMTILFVLVPEAKSGKNRLHLDLRPSRDSTQATEVDRLLALGAERVDIGQGEVSWVVLADPEGNELCVLADLPPLP